MATARPHIVVLVALAACDPLVESPQLTTPTVAIVAPKQNTKLVQPGPTIDVELEVSGCLDVEQLSLFAGATELQGAELTRSAKTGRHHATLQTADLLQLFLYGPASGWAVDLQARLLCGDYQQRVRSGWQRIFLSPFSRLETARSSIYHLQAGPGAGEVLALSEDALLLFFHPQGTKSTHGAPDGLVRQVKDHLYYWMDCKDVWCLNKTGTLFELTTTLGILAPQRLELSDAPVELVAAPDADRLLIAVEGKVGAPRLIFADLDLGNTSESKLAVDPVAPARRTKAGEVVLLGFPRPGGAAKVQLLTVASGETVSSIQAELDWRQTESVWALSPSGARAAVLQTGGGTLARIDAASGAVSKSKVALAPGESSWRSLAFVGETQLLIDAQQTVRLHACSSGKELWRVAPARGVEAAAVLPGGGVALLTGELELLLVDAKGKVVHESGPLPKSWRLTSNLLATDKYLYFALERFLAGYALK